MSVLKPWLQRGIRLAPAVGRREAAAASAPSTSALVDRFHADGFCLPICISELKGESFRNTYLPRYLAFRERCVAEAQWSEYRFKSHLVLPWLHQLLVRNERLQELAQGLLKTRTVVIWSTDWCVKPKGSPEHFTWHQDSTYSKFGHEGVTLWIAFSHVKQSSGPVLYRRASHRLGQLPHTEDLGDNTNLLAFGQRISEDDSTPVDWLPAERGSADQNIQRNWTALEVVPGCDLHPGEASAHSFLTVHCSQANQDDEDRVGLAVRLVAASAGAGRSDRVTLLCGDESDLSQDQAGNSFELERHVPQSEFGAREVAEWQASMEREKEMYFDGHNVSVYK